SSLYLLFFMLFCSPYCPAELHFSTVPFMGVRSDTLVAMPITLFGIGLRETLFQELLGTIYSVPGGAAALISLGGFGLQATVSILGGLLVPFTTASSRSTGHAAPDPT
ncbi:MAG: hypothetical protein ORN23_09620, partial [Chthoniobacterales bacterium]|nr:hypothetical protein [Chthoniobacterales bacterium]